MMRKVSLFIAMSLDGYIADRRGGVGWLNGQDADAQTADVYAEFIQDVDTVVMGWNTYHQIAFELSPTEWVYAGLTSYVVTHRKLPPTDQIVFTEKNPSSLVRELKEQAGKKIWICGGAAIAQQLISADLIDEYYISVIPTVLGSGIRLFDTAPDEIPLKLTDVKADNGIAALVYQRR